MRPKLTPILQRGCKGKRNAYLPRQGLKRPTDARTTDVLMHSISLWWGLVGVSLTCRGVSDVLETAFTVQKAPCTFRGKGHPLQKTSPVRWARPKYGPNSFKFKLMRKWAAEPRVAGFGPCRPKFGPNIRIE